MLAQLEVICGPMFSGKSEELIRRVRRSQIAKQKIQVFKPSLDDRYSKYHIQSHTDLSIEAYPVKDSGELFNSIKDSTKVIAIDEVQFFDEGIIEVILRLIKRSVRVIVAGLDLDYKGDPFGPMPQLLALADEVTKVHAICTICGESATRTERIVLSEDLVLLGEKNHYEARCKAHHAYS